MLKPRKLIAFGVILISFLFTVPFFFQMELRRNREGGNLFRHVTLSSAHNDLSIGLCQNAKEDVWYAFLPSGLEIECCRIEYQDAARITFDEASFSSGELLRELSAERQYDVTFYEKDGGVLERGTVVFYETQNTATLTLSLLADGALEMIKADPSKETTLHAVYQTYFPDGRPDAGGSCELGGRGNLTWRGVETKKPYKIDLTEAASLLGMRKMTRWTLLANYFDDTYLKNRITLEAARELDCEFTPEEAFVNLYVNGEYQGLYQLTQKADASGGCVEIGKETEDTFLLEFDDYGNWAEEWQNKNQPAFRTKENYISVIFPAKATAERIASIAALTEEAERLIYLHDERYDRLLEKDSWVKQFMLQEYFLNKDADFSSMFFYKKPGDPLLYAGPLWDMDRIMGSGQYSIHYNGLETQVLWLPGMYGEERGSNRGWYKDLYQIPSFQAAVRECWRSRLSSLAGRLITEAMPAWREEIGASVRMDYALYGYDVQEWSGAVDRMARWLTERKAFFDALWIEGAPFATVTFVTRHDEDNGHDMIYYIRTGTPLPAIPDGEGIVSWIDADGRTVAAGDLITEDLTLYPVYEEETQEAAVEKQEKQ